MKKFLLLVLIFNGLTMSFAQNPVIEGELMLCPDTNGTATVVNQTYDTYQWYSKYWFTDDEYTPISGATQQSFTYDWFTYDQSLFKVVVTLGSATFESNVIQIDSYNWSTLMISSELNDYVYSNLDNGNFMLCPGGSFTNTLISPYEANIQWFKDGSPIDGATQTSYEISAPGSYYVIAAPGICPESTSSSQESPLIVEADMNCTLANDHFEADESIVVYPNPVLSILKVNSGQSGIINSYRILDGSGKVLLSNDSIQHKNITIDVSALSDGIYILIMQSDSGKSSKKFVKH